MDKLRTKEIWSAAGLPTPPFMRVYADSDWSQVVREVGLPLMVKPVHEGSSIGMSKVVDAAALPEAVALALSYDAQVIVEKWITGQEYTTTILDGKPLPMICLRTPHAFYDYAAKYQADTTEYLCPCGLPEAREQDFQALAMRAFEVVNADGWGRVDMMVDEAGLPWLIEANTVPGMTDHSLVPMAARAAGIEFDELVVRILASSLKGAN